MVEYGVHAWDVAAIVPIVEEAGGRFSNWDGGLDINRPDVLVSNGAAARDVPALFRNVVPRAVVPSDAEIRPCAMLS